ncbi:hypothetical protein D3C87_1288960 [compost metagenome]|jgi:hypothetical protein|uniref:Uncharacterized protein n=1 Tax=Cupriavidus campinensis TaxID=151783 RepID=A0AAE9I197_9BURK|nr:MULTISPECIES: hypothetical protein [Cupriavidus]URF05702.1 hypothetical protein M5D45_07875 [Cupriavidus campinensis]
MGNVLVRPAYGRGGWFGMMAPLKKAQSFGAKAMAKAKAQSLTSPRYGSTENSPESKNAGRCHIFMLVGVFVVV